MDIDGNPIWFSSQNNRGAQIGVFPSSIIKETSVYKTVTPDQDGNSVGGHISLRTLRAFDGGSRPYLSLGGRIGRFDQDSIVNSGPSMRLYGAAKTTFGADRQYGVVVGFNAQRMRNSDKYGGVDTYAQVNGEDQVNASNLYSSSLYDKDVKNAVGYAKVEMRKNDGLYAFLSGTIIDDSRRQYLDREGTYIYNTAGRTTNFSNGAADFNKAIGQTKQYDYDIKRKAKMLGGGVDYQVGRAGVLAVRANYTDFNNTIVTRYPETFQLSNLSGHYDLNGDLPTTRYDSPATYNDPANWINRNTTASYVRDQDLRDKVSAVKADYSQNTFPEARGLGFAAGASWTRLDRTYDQGQANYLLPKGTVLKLSDVAAPGATMADNAAIRMNWDKFWTYVYANGIKTTDRAPASDYALVEDVFAGHAEAYLSGARYRLIAGLRYENTHDQDDTGDTVGGVSTPSRRINHYGNWMPNIQGSYDLTARLKLKAAFTKTIGRPDFADIAPGSIGRGGRQRQPRHQRVQPEARPAPVHQLRRQRGILSRRRLRFAGRVSQGPEPRDLQPEDPDAGQHGCGDPHPDHAPQQWQRPGHGRGGLVRQAAARLSARAVQPPGVERQLYLPGQPLDGDPDRRNGAHHRLPAQPAEVSGQCRGQLRPGTGRPACRLSGAGARVHHHLRNHADRRPVDQALRPTRRPDQLAPGQGAAGDVRGPQHHRQLYDDHHRRDGRHLQQRWRRAELFRRLQIPLLRPAG